MYKIFADGTLIYDSTLEDYKIGKGSITLETNKTGSFVFSVYLDHFYYDKFVKLKTVIIPCKKHAFWCCFSHIAAHDSAYVFVKINFCT